MGWGVPCLAPVQTQVVPVQNAFRSLGPKDLFAPSPNHFREFPISDPLSQPAGFANLERAESREEREMGWGELENAEQNSV